MQEVCRCCRPFSTWQPGSSVSWHRRVRPICLLWYLRHFSASRHCARRRCAGTLDVLRAGLNTFRALWQRLLSTHNLVSVCTIWNWFCCVKLLIFSQDFSMNINCYKYTYLLTYLPLPGIIINPLPILCRACADNSFHKFLAHPLF